MHFKKSTAIVLTVLILFSNLGLAFNVRFCNDKVALVAVNYEFSESSCSTTETSCCASEAIHKKCCSTKVVKLDKKSEKILTKSFQLDLEKHILVVNSLLQFKYESNTAKRNKIVAFCYDSNAPPFYKLYCQYVFYA